MTTHILNFQPRFAELVASGAKRQTIRLLRKRPIAFGDTLRLYTGLRRPGARLLAVGRVTSVQTIRLNWRKCLLDWKPQTKMLDTEFAQRTRIARLDGFSNWNEMIQWFERTHGLPFNGVLIRWKLDAKRGEP